MKKMPEKMKEILDYIRFYYPDMMSATDVGSLLGLKDPKSQQKWLRDVPGIDVNGRTKYWARDVAGKIYEGCK